MLLRVLLVLTTCGVILAVSRSAPAQTNREPDDQQEIHWAIQLGMRVHVVDQAFPLLDRVVLVPDAATYVDELAKWSPAGRWPVLIEDDHFAPMFIRRFQPSEVVQRDSVGDWPNGRADREQVLGEIPVRAWGGNPNEHTLGQVLDGHGYEPPGIVIASVDDPAWPAAVALAAGRGQPLVFVSERPGRPGAVMREDAAAELADQINSLIAAQGYNYESLGDTIDTITLCRALPGRINVPHQRTGELEAIAISDYLGRDADGSRYALVGWIFGSETRSAYVAMCSLFLPRESIRLYNTYPGDGPWQQFTVEPAAGMLAQRGFEVTSFSGESAREIDWLKMIQSGVAVDIFAVNTKGNVDFFDLPNARVTTNDVPVLNHPSVVHFTHSWSMRSPDDDATIAGRFLEGGAYGYVGSVAEPTLAAFLPPLALAERWAKLSPVLIAARHWVDPPPLRTFGGAWKVNLYGDPLMIAVPPANNKQERVERAADYGVNVGDLVRERMRAIDTDESGDAIADSIAILDLLGRDAIAVQLWRLAVQRELTTPAAGVALGPLFRAGKPDEFLHAWQESGRHDDRALTMLWHKLTPTLAGMRDEELLLQFQNAMRRPHVHGDLARLAPLLQRSLGTAHARRVIEREIERAENRRTRQELEKLLRNLRD